MVLCRHNIQLHNCVVYIINVPCTYSGGSANVIWPPAAVSSLSPRSHVPPSSSSGTDAPSEQTSKLLSVVLLYGPL